MNTPLVSASSKLTRLGRNLALMLLAAFIAVGCASTRKEKIGVKIEEPLDDVKTDNRYWRAVGNGESIQSEMAKKIARTNALAKLASQIEVTVKQVNDDYSSQLQVSDRQEVNQKFESLTRTVVKQTLTDVKDVKDEMRFLKDKDRYNYYLGIEVNKKEYWERLKDQMSQAISRDERLKVSYDKKKYEETFDKEMKKLEQEEGTSK
jgi:hypothetical protein